MRNNIKNKREIKKINEEILKLKYELEERYNDYYAADIGYEYSKSTYGKHDRAYKVLDIKENILCDINYLQEEIRILEDKKNALRLSSYEDRIINLKYVFQ